MGDSYNPTTNEHQIFRVRDINWADPNIYRAGIIPIYNDGTYKWIGLGVTMFSTSITAIGGSYEVKDKDLLTTASREYNEEVGANLRNVIDESLYNCYAIKTNYTIQILLPISSRPYRFTATPELYTMIWVTTRQLEAMERISESILPGPGSRSRALTFSSEFKNLSSTLIYAVDHDIPFKITLSTESFPRPEKISKLTGKTKEAIITDIVELENDAKIPSNFIGHIGIVISPNAIGIIRQNKVIYLLPITDVNKVLTVLENLKLRILIATDTDKKWLHHHMPTYNKRNITSIENYSVSRNIEGADPIIAEFMKKLEMIEERQIEMENNIDKLRLIAEYELKLYEVVQHSNQFFNTKRACYLDAFNVINNALSLGAMPLLNVRQNLGCLRCNINGTSMLTFWINSGIFIQDPETTILSIPTNYEPSSS